jgi:Cu/Ag efflux protein CusF
MRYTPLHSRNEDATDFHSSKTYALLTAWGIVQPTEASLPRTVRLTSNHNTFRINQAMKATLQNTLSRITAATALVVLSSTASAQTASTDGEIRKVDIAAGRVVIKHGEWKGMNMPPMTMGFEVRNRAHLDGLKVNDKVHFSIEKVGRDYVVTSIEPLPGAAVASARK